MASSDTIRITTWNVNGIRNPFAYQPWRENRTFSAMFDTLEADIIIMQELKIQRKDLRDDMVLIDGWDCFFSLPKHKKGYSGVGIYTRSSKCAPIRAEEGVIGVLSPPDTTTKYCELPDERAIGGYLSPSQLADVEVDPVALDAEGRCVVLEFPAFVLFGVYSPANSNGLRDDFRYGFLQALDYRIRNLTAMGKRVVLTGDLNVSRDERDSACAEEDLKKEGLTPADFVSTPNRRIFNQLINGGSVIGSRDEGRGDPVLSDLCRDFHPDRRGMYTHWEQKINARPGNYGSRIDYVLCSISMRPWFIDSNIQEGLLGSDHCPVYAVMKNPLSIAGEDHSIHEMMNPSGMFKGGKRLREWSNKDLLPFSGKLLPEFDRRRSIKDMFRKQTSTKAELVVVPQVSTNDSFETVAHQSLVAEPKKTFQKPVIPESSKRAKPPSPSPITASPLRVASDSHLPPSKRRKPNGTTKDSNGTSNTQKSLKSFFQPKQQKPDVTSTPSRPLFEFKSPSKSQTTLATLDSPANKNTSPKSEADPDGAADQLVTESTFYDDLIQSQNEAQLPDPFTPERYIDPSDTKVEWTKIFSKRDAPRCEGHKEPCISLETKKKGPNCGRRFWICPR